MTTDDHPPAREGRFRRMLRRLGLSRGPAPAAPAMPQAPPAIAPAPPSAPAHGAPSAAGADPRWPHTAGAAYAQPQAPPTNYTQPAHYAHPGAQPAQPGAYGANGAWNAWNGAPPPEAAGQSPWAPAGQQPAPAGPGASDGSALLTDALAGLAVRDLTMVESLLDIVGSLEDSTEDPDLLAKLFEIDNLATRMRRNGENLLVLADQESDDSGVEPVALLDVARAATSEIKNYSRVQIGRLPDKFVAGEVADDLSHLLAELMDNATSHSPDHAQVVISGQPMTEGGLLVVVEDEGIGIPRDQLADINSRLAGTPVLDKRVMRHMGLYVASRIAHRHGLRVQLEARAFRGVSAYTVVPQTLLSAVGPRPQPGARDGAGAAGQAVPAMAAVSQQPAGAHHAGVHRGAAGAADGSGAGAAGSGRPAANAVPPQAAHNGGPRRDGGTDEVTAAGLPRRSAANSSPLRMMPTEEPAPPAEEPGDRAERIRDDLDGFIEGERAASRDGSPEEGP